MEEQLGLFPEPVPPAPTTADLMAKFQAIQDRLDSVEAENRQLRQAQIIASQEAAIPGHLVASGGQISSHPGVARHVVIGTRPVFDNPTDPLWNGLNKVDPGSLARKSEG